MIKYVNELGFDFTDGFRLLNSEIGNDPASVAAEGAVTGWFSSP